MCETIPEAMAVVMGKIPKFPVVSESKNTGNTSGLCDRHTQVQRKGAMGQKGAG